MEHILDEPRKRITARVSDSVRDTLEQAAELLGASVNQFVVQTAYVEAQREIERESVIRLSQKDAGHQDSGRSLQRILSGQHHDADRRINRSQDDSLPRMLRIQRATKARSGSESH